MTSTTTGTDGRTIVRLSDPGELIAAVPHLLSFRPGSSVVLLNHSGGGHRRIVPVIRADLPDESFEPEAVRELVRAVLRHPGGGVTVVVVGSGPGHRAPPGDVPHRRLVRRLISALKDDRPVDHVLWVPEIRGGARWRCYHGDCGPGVVPDDRDTVMAATMAARGWVPYASREELERQLEPDDSAAITRRRHMLEAALDELDDRSRTPGRFDDEKSAEHLSAVRAALARAVAGDFTLSDGDVVSLALALSDGRVRDRCLTTADEPDEAASRAAERLWLELVRRTPPPERAGPATLLAYAAYRRGDCVLASLALDNALTAHPGHGLAEPLKQALEHHITPDALRRVTEFQEGGLMSRDP
ncbi:DUF4192 domain-containing protein [Amycolatopsis endophytica]|uniref:DUF4192 domain-containing protein n=1 Tax=Amycolatopsis endophytica TaxID=860233 RepID=A0A853B7E8_9PSEU|nr:DUF4192 domain-containing protein [Amycolatopsis endophytica]NYI90436.1 hypothetical protein [Amycolatopsis endophytica]